MRRSNKENGRSGNNSREARANGLHPLVERIRDYDSIRRKLETGGGTVSDIAAITELLDEPVTIRDELDCYTVKLTEHEALRRTLGMIRGHKICFDVRIPGNGMPVYYLCRTRGDFLANRRFVVEDMYRSPGYPSLDDRFCRLMHLGHESCFLRVSHVRDRAGRMSGLTNPPDADEIDDVLLAVGKGVLQSAWHEDQLSGILTSKHFGLGNFRDAIELIYLCLGADLCALRTGIDAEMLEFFETAYPQRAIRSFLGAMRQRAGSDLVEIGRRALRCYALLSEEYGAFLRTEVQWKHGGANRPLFTLMFGNFYRLESLAGLADLNAALGEASARLESSSKSVIATIVGDDIAARAA